jgi:site-specific recombinase XerD
MNATPSSLTELVTAFFTRHLASERNASGHTIATYRDTFRLLLVFLGQAQGRPVSQLTLDAFSPDAILHFLEFLEQQRGNSVRTRNVRLAAIRSFFTYVISQEPAAGALAQRILHIPFKKPLGRAVDYLTKEEVEAMLAQPTRTTLKGRRDYLVLALLYDTGGRIEEVLNLCPADFRLDRLPLVRLMGKGRKQRIVPLLPITATLVRQHVEETHRSPTDTEQLLRNARGTPLTRSGAAFLLEQYRRQAVSQCPTLARKGITPHRFRHTKAMHMLQAGISPVTIKDILGHAHLKTLEAYVQADLEMKRRALEATPSPVRVGPPVQRHAPDLLHWLEQL